MSSVNKTHDKNKNNNAIKSIIEKFPVYLLISIFIINWFVQTEFNHVQSPSQTLPSPKVSIAKKSNPIRNVRNNLSLLRNFTIEKVHALKISSTKKERMKELFLAYNLADGDLSKNFAVEFLRELRTVKS